MSPQPPATTMSEEHFKIILIFDIKEYGSGRLNAVKERLESPEYGSILMMTYGNGMLDAFCNLYGEGKASAEIQSIIDAEIAKIDPDWLTNGIERLTTRPICIDKF